MAGLTTTTPRRGWSSTSDCSARVNHHVSPSCPTIIRMSTVQPKQSHTSPSIRSPRACPVLTPAIHLTPASPDALTSSAQAFAGEHYSTVETDTEATPQPQGGGKSEKPASERSVVVSVAGKTDLDNTVPELSDGTKGYIKLSDEEYSIAALEVSPHTLHGPCLASHASPCAAPGWSLVRRQPAHVHSRARHGHRRAGCL